MSRITFTYELDYYMKLAKIWGKIGCPSRNRACILDDSIISSIFVPDPPEKGLALKRFFPDAQLQKLDLGAVTELRHLDIAKMLAFLANIAKDKEPDEQW